VRQVARWLVDWPLPGTGGRLRDPDRPHDFTVGDVETKVVNEMAAAWRGSRREAGVDAPPVSHTAPRDSSAPEVWREFPGGPQRLR
jgi:hypothetical protein